MTTPSFQIKPTTGIRSAHYPILFVIVSGNEQSSPPMKLPDATSCDTYKAFWLSWTGDMVSLGSGEVPFKNNITSVRDQFTPRSIHHLQLADAGRTTPIEWLFSTTVGRE